MVGHFGGDGSGEKIRWKEIWSLGVLWVQLLFRGVGGKRLVGRVGVVGLYVEGPSKLCRGEKGAAVRGEVGGWLGMSRIKLVLRRR